VGDAQKRISLIKVLGELIGHCGLDLILPRSRLLARVVESTSSRITSFAAVLLPSGRLALSLDCSESENIQHAIGADGNPLVSVHAEGDRV
jgi:hypothetical protein